MTRRFQGMNAWLLQRVSAIYIAVFVLYVVAVYLFKPPLNYMEFKAWITHPFMSICLMVFVALLLGHAWVGMRDVFMDYIPSLVIRAAALLLLAFGLVACGIWTARILLLAML